MKQGVGRKEGRKELEWKGRGIWIRGEVERERHKDKSRE